MIRFARCLACWILLVNLLPAQSPQPQITESFPTPGELRKPDISFADPGSGKIWPILYTPDGRVLATAGRGGAIHLWQSRTGEQVTGELLGTLDNEARVLTFDFKPDGTLAAFLMNGKISTWNVTSRTLLQTCDLKIESPRWGAIRPGAAPEAAVLATDSNRIDLLNYETGKTIRSYSIETKGGRVWFSPDGAKLLYHAYITTPGAAAPVNDTVEIFDTDSGGGIRSMPLHSGGVIAPANAFFLAADEKGVSVIPYNADQPIKILKTSGAAKSYGALAVNGRADMIAAGALDGSIDVWDTSSSLHLCTQAGKAIPIAIAFVSHNQKMASSDRDGTISYWTAPIPDVPAETLEKIKAALPAKSTAMPKKPRRILVFWRADAILHKGGVPAVNRAIELMGEKTGAYEADFSRDYDALNLETLEKYDALVMNSTAHLAIPEKAKQAYLDFAKNGGGIVAIHAAIDTFRDWPEGQRVIGATFGGHPWGPGGNWAVHLDEPDHPLLRAFGGKDFKIHDEVYELGEPYTRADRRVLMTLDVSDAATARPGAEKLHRADRDFAVSYIKRNGNSRVFYCDFGHIADPFTRPEVLQYYLDGIQYVLGDLEADDSPKP